MVKIFVSDNTIFNYTKTNSCDTLVTRNRPVLSETYGNAITRNKSHTLHEYWVLTQQNLANIILLLFMVIVQSRKIID
jgi:hypothetical protein